VPNATATNGIYYDGSFVDASRGFYYLGDRSTKGIDIIDIASSEVIGASCRHVRWYSTAKS
jgi:hypothetical protein